MPTTDHSEESFQYIREHLLYTNVYYAVHDYFVSSERRKLAPEALQQIKQQLIQALEELTYKIVIPSSRLDSTIIKILKDDLKIENIETDRDIVIDIREIETTKISRRIYDLTVMGTIEKFLQEMIVDDLRSHLLSTIESEYQRLEMHYDDIWQEYQRELDDFSDGDYGYEYEGPIQPEAPTLRLPRKEDFIAEELEALDVDLNNPRDIYRVVPVQKGLMGDLLHQYFYDADFVDDILLHLNLEKVSRDNIIHMLRTKDLYFFDCDICQRKFLLNILIDNIEHDFNEDYFGMTAEHMAKLFMAAAVKIPALKSELDNYNVAIENNDVLAAQKIWLVLANLCQYLERQVSANKNVEHEHIAPELERQYLTFRERHNNDIETLVKVFPADKSNCLYFPNVTEPVMAERYFSKYQQDYYRCDSASLPLEPYFYMLYSIAQQSHTALVNAVTSKTKKGTVKKTNIVTGMLSFAVSLRSEEQILSGKKDKRRFVTVPLELKYPKKLLSKDYSDGVFSDNNDFETSIAQDLQLGSQVAGRSADMSEERESDARKLMMRLIGTLDLSDEKKSEFFTSINEAAMATPVALKYFTDPDVAKSTEGNHSERILLRALKEPDNIDIILQHLYMALTELGVFSMGTYIIHTSALVIYSYPNSICDPCALSLLAAQNSYDAGFLKEFIEQANKLSINNIRFRTRGFGQDSTLFNLSVVAASYSIFTKDTHAKRLVETRPDAKLFARKTAFRRSESGINLHVKQDIMRNRFFEFTDAKQPSTEGGQKLVPLFSGHVFMSGSKKNKLTASNEEAIEKGIEELMDQFNEDRDEQAQRGASSEAASSSLRR